MTLVSSYTDDCWHRGEKWILEENLNELVQYCAAITDRSNFFVLLNLYSMGLSGTIGCNLIKARYHKEATCGECIVPGKDGFDWPLFTRVRGVVMVLCIFI